MCLVHIYGCFSKTIIPLQPFARKKDLVCPNTSHAKCSMPQCASQHLSLAECASHQLSHKERRNDIVKIFFCLCVLSLSLHSQTVMNVWAELKVQHDVELCPNCVHMPGIGVYFLRAAAEHPKLKRKRMQFGIHLVLARWHGVLFFSLPLHWQCSVSLCFIAKVTSTQGYLLSHCLHAYEYDTNMTRSKKNKIKKFPKLPLN